MLQLNTETRYRRRQLDKIRATIETEYTKEEHIQAALRDSYWLFGGSCIASVKRRRYTTDMEIDIPLLRPDGSLHVVELKRANVSLIKRHRTGLTVHSAVHEGVSQAIKRSSPNVRSPSSPTKNSSTMPNARSTCRHPAISQIATDREGGDLAV